MTTFLSSDLTIYQPINVWIDPSSIDHISTSIYLSIYLPIHPASHPSIHPPFLSTAHRPKVVRMWCVLNILTSKWAFHHCYDVFRATGTRVFSHLNSQKWPETLSIVTLLRHKLSERGVFLTFWLRNLLRLNSMIFLDIAAAKSGPNVHGVSWTFWLRNVLRTTTAGTFWTSQVPKVVRTCGAFIIFTLICAIRHNGVHFLNISTSKGAPRMRLF